jgi:hypothetical protein
MLSSKIRTTVIGLAATFSVAAAFGQMAPAASADYVRLHYEYCHQMKEAFEAEIEKYAKSEGTDVEAFNEAVEDVKVAEAHECSWTGGESSRIKTLTTRMPAGTLHLSTPEGGTVSPVRSVTSTTPTSALR